VAIFRDAGSALARSHSLIDASWTKARSLAAPVASGWSGCRVGLAPTGNAPPFHGAHPKRTPDQPNVDSPAVGRYIQAMTPTCSVLLDLDGTLIDSQPGILASSLAALRALGHEPDETLDIKRAIGPPLEDMMRVLLQQYGDDRVGEAVAAYRQHYGESGFLGSEPYPGIGRSLKEMQQAGLRIYLATSKREIFASRILHHLGFATYFDGIHGSVPGGGLDHKPELLAHILSQHKVLPSHSLMVGDRRYDISGAHAVGMRGRFFRWSVGSNLRARPLGGSFKSEALCRWRSRQREFPP